MKRQPRPIVILLVIAGAMALLAGWRAMNEPPEVLPWRKTLEEAQRESAASGKPVLAYFTASWCPPCQRMKRQTWPDPHLQKALEAWVLVKIDINAEPEIARRFGAAAIPRVQLIAPNGEPGAARVGFISADDLLRWLQGAKGESTMGG